MSAAIAQSDFGVAVEGSFSWANSDAANTVRTLNIPVQGVRHSRMYSVAIYNPGVSGIFVNIQSGETLAAGARYANTAETITVAAGSSVIVVLPNLFVGELARVTAQNAAALGLTDAFTATIRIRPLLD